MLKFNKAYMLSDDAKALVAAVTQAGLSKYYEVSRILRDGFISITQVEVKPGEKVDRTPMTLDNVFVITDAADLELAKREQRILLIEDGTIIDAFSIEAAAEEILGIEPEPPVVEQPEPEAVEIDTTAAVEPSAPKPKPAAKKRTSRRRK